MAATDRFDREALLFARATARLANEGFGKGGGDHHDR